MSELWPKVRRALFKKCTKARVKKFAKSVLLLQDNLIVSSNILLDILNLDLQSRSPYYYSISTNIYLLFIILFYFYLLFPLLY